MLRLFTTGPARHRWTELRPRKELVASFGLLWRRQDVTVALTARTSSTLLSVLLVGLVCSPDVEARKSRKAPPCTGRFVVDGFPLLMGTGMPTSGKDLVVVNDKVEVLSGCPPISPT